MHLIRNIAIVVLGVAVIAIGYWGYQEHQEKNAISIQAENHYQQTFHDLTYHMDQLQDKIGSALVMNRGDAMTPALTEVWRLTSQAHSEIGQLPLTLMPFHETEGFLSNIGQFSYQVSSRDLDEKPMTKDEYGTLKKLYKRSSNIEKQLRGVQASVMKNHLQWTDVKMALANEKEPTDNTIVGGMKTVDQQVQGYDNINWGPEISHLSKTKESKYEKLEGKKISKQEAKKATRKFLDFNKDVSMTVKATGKNTDYDAYTVSLENPNNGANIQMDISKKGAHPLWMIQDNKSGKAKISLNKASTVAKKFLKNHGKKHMTMTKSSQYDDIGVFTFVQKKDHVRIYPESIRLKVSLGNGNIVGYDATNYVAYQKKRNLDKKPSLNKKEAQKNVNQNVDVKQMHMATITNDNGKEVLCYEMIGTMNNDTYQIFINANSGRAEKVKKMNNPQPIYRTS